MNPRAITPKMAATSSFAALFFIWAILVWMYSPLLRRPVYFGATLSFGLLWVCWLHSSADLSKTLRIEFKIKDSWLTEVAAIGAALGTIVDAKFLPDKIAGIPATYVSAMNASFLMVLVISPFVLFLAKKFDAVSWYLVAAFLTMFAVFGQLTTLWTVVSRVYVYPSAAFWYATLLVGLAAGVAGAYAWTQISSKTDPTETRSLL